MEAARAIIIASYKDSAKAAKLSESLAEFSIGVSSVFELLDDDVKDGIGEADGRSESERLGATIRLEKNIIFFISQDAVASPIMAELIAGAYLDAKERGKTLITVAEGAHLIEQNDRLNMLLSSGALVIPEDGESVDRSFLSEKIDEIITDLPSAPLCKFDEGLKAEDDYRGIALRVTEIISRCDAKELLYEKIAALLPVGYSPAIVQNLRDLVSLLCSDLRAAYTSASRRGFYKELLRCAELLALCSETGYSSDDRTAAHKRLDAMNLITEWLGSSDFRSMDLFLISVALKINYLDFTVRSSAANTLSGGEKHGAESEELAKTHLASQHFFLQLYNLQMNDEKIDEYYHGGYPDDEVETILNAGSFLIQGSPEYEGRKEAFSTEMTDTEKQLHAIADHMRQSNSLFEEANNNALAVEFYKCLRVSYERLLNYSRIVNCASICAECTERIAELKAKLENMGAGSDDHGIAESGIKAFLGFSVAGIDDFDVFICHNHEDKSIAQKIYSFLRQHLINPFIDSSVLPDIGESEYRRAIANALDHSRNFILVLSDLQYLDSFWVDYETDTFIHEKVEGRKPNSNIVIIVTDELYKQIKATNKECLPYDLRRCEIMTVLNYQTNIIKYVRSNNVIFR